MQREENRMKDYCLFIPYVNRPDLVRAAYISVEELGPAIIDNSGKQKSYLLDVCATSALTFAQTMNFGLKFALEVGHKYCLFLHGDAEASQAVGEELLCYCREHKKWGAIFTHYDAFVALNVAAYKAVGPWDTNLPQYFSDCDYYRRLRLAGYETLESGLGDRVKHTPSQTINSDPKLKFLNGITFPLYRQYYIAKWGGEPGKERFSIAFDGKCPEQLQKSA
jgi:hypothetical protein